MVSPNLLLKMLFSSPKIESRSFGNYQRPKTINKTSQNHSYHSYSAADVVLDQLLDEDVSQSLEVVDEPGVGLVGALLLYQQLEQVVVLATEARHVGRLLRHHDQLLQQVHL
jgi:hypothetical protein